MKTIWIGVRVPATLAVFAVGLLALPALADDAVGGRSASTRDVQAAVDSYLATGSEDASLIGGTGSAGYDAGFWIRGGDFLLRINATLQARFEAWDWDDEDAARDSSNLTEDAFAGDTSGFSLPRATLKLSGEAPCNISWYVELEFGHFGRDPLQSLRDDREGENLGASRRSQSFNYDNTREAWIEWGHSRVFNVRMGQLQTPNTRQAMVQPELQQFVDVSLATSFTMLRMPGLTDRNRDHGVMFHGAFGCREEWSYMFAVTNGDGGDSIRNVLDHRTSDNLAYSARFNWAFLAPIGYEEGALRQQTCRWYGEVGVFAHYYADRVDKSHRTVWDMGHTGIDLALGVGNWSLTAAVTAIGGDSDGSFFRDRVSGTWLVQLGYQFQGTPWEIAVRASGYEVELSGPTEEKDASEYALGVNYYLNGHANKLQLDVSYISTTDDDLFTALYPGYQDGVDDGEAIMIRFQWQLAL